MDGGRGPIKIRSKMPWTLRPADHDPAYESAKEKTQNEVTFGNALKQLAPYSIVSTSVMGTEN